MPFAQRPAKVILPVVLAVTAPLLVFLGLQALHSVWWTFALYQVTICLLLPSLESRALDRSWRGHLDLLGLVHDRPPWRMAWVIGGATLLLTSGFLVLTRDRFLDAERLQDATAAWGVAPDQLPAMLGFMAVFNALAEELFWRGYLPGRFTERAQPTPPSPWQTIILPAVFYASYHGYTIGVLVRHPWLTALMTSGVLGGGLIWGWLRQRTGSVLPALFSHAGAVIGYLVVYWVLIG